MTRVRAKNNKSGGYLPFLGESSHRSCIGLRCDAHYPAARNRAANQGDVLL